MDQWTVILRKPDGLHFEVIEADYAERSEDGNSINFVSLEKAEDLFDSVKALFEKEPSYEDLKKEVIRLIRSVANVYVASFERKSVIGYFKGLRVSADIKIEVKP